MAYIPIMIPLVLIYMLVDLLKESDLLSGTQGLLGFILDKMVARFDMYNGLFLRQTDPNAE
jgi:hypothetical protein